MKLLACVLLAAGILSGQQTWNAVCMEGPPEMPNGKCSLEIHGDAVSLHAKHNPDRSIPVNAISSVIYSPAKFRRSSSVGLDSCSGPAQGCGGLLVAAGTAWLILYPMKGTHHYVNIAWNDRGAEQEIMLELGKQEYLPFLEGLRQTTGKQWINVNAPKR